ncbi:hypothetical protein [uncultured Massilia sp.]|uniref:MutS-related protein n=1 Tax=uncultured Massilia sp. TaxID=169973 RepID=UPI0025FEB3A6|nr:hypothetical protein [uncultured Massilia sp.]
MTLAALRQPFTSMPGWLARLAPPGEPEPVDYPFAPGDVARLHALAGHDGHADLDAQTWRDLLLERYGAVLAPQASIFGRQVLYRRLRAGMPDAGVATQRERVRRLLDAPDRLDALRRSLRALRSAEAEVAGVLFDDAAPAAPPPPRLVARAPLLAVLLLASVALALLVSPLGWIGVGGALYLLVAMQMRWRERAVEWHKSTHALQMLLRTCVLLDGSDLPLAEAFSGLRQPAGRLGRALARSPLATAVPGAGEYGDWFLAANIRHYFATLRLVDREKPFLRRCFSLCAELDADAALAHHLRGRADWCWAGRTGPRALALEGGVHPLLDGGAALSLALDGEGVFLSGQNGVGKSTFLRMLGLNLVVARAFGFCYARRAELPALPVVASMQNEDSLLDGHSLYVAELARARDLLAAAARGPVVCLVDEVFRGTNHEESVSAAVAVLDGLARDALVVVSSHNLVLGPLLAHRLAPWRIVRAEDGALRMEPGVLGTTNGVALLAQRGFDAEVQRKARQVAGWLAGQRKGEAGADLLAPGA